MMREDEHPVYTACINCLTLIPANWVKDDESSDGHYTAPECHACDVAHMLCESSTCRWLCQAALDSDCRLCYDCFREVREVIGVEYTSDLDVRNGIIHIVLFSDKHGIINEASLRLTSRQSIIEAIDLIIKDTVLEIYNMRTGVRLAADGCWYSYSGPCSFVEWYGEDRAPYKWLCAGQRSYTIRIIHDHNTVQSVNPSWRHYSDPDCTIWRYLFLQTIISRISTEEIRLGMLQEYH